jgi:purine-nucleoside phosphorylase
MLLVVAAYPPELDGLDGKAVGIGLVDAAAGTARAIAEAKPSRLVLVGTAGAIDAKLAIGDVVVAKSAALIARAVESLPGAMASEVEAPFGDEAASALGVPAVRVGCALGVTNSDEEAARLQQFAVEHMECYAVLRAAAQAGVPATAVLAIANRVGRDGSRQWMANRRTAEAAAVSACKRLVERYR